MCNRKKRSTKTRPPSDIAKDGLASAKPSPGPGSVAADKGQVKNLAKMPSPKDLTDQSVAAPPPSQYRDTGTASRLLLSETWKGIALIGGGLVTAVSVAFAAGGVPLAVAIMVAYLLLCAMGMIFVILLGRRR